ncbi:MAG: MFS transporter [Myxococcota bacterium]
MSEPLQGASSAPFLTQLRSFGGIYWIANWMELVERFAYYGVRVVLPVFMVLAIEDGGPQLDHVQKGTIYAVWAILQSFVPILSGGFADQYGFKLNIALSTALKIIGYLVMGWCIPIAELMAGSSLAEARAAGLDRVFEVFFVGAMFLAVGTAIFKPGVQGMIGQEMPKQSASLGWALFYQVVNIGGFLGPFVAGYLRVLDWQYVFLVCAVAIALNFIPLFFFKEPERSAAKSPEDPLTLLYRSIQGLLEPRLFFFTITFAGFWLMFYQLFDILPNFIDDWVDSRGLASALQGLFGQAAVPTLEGGNLTQEWMINFNALLISFAAFLIGYLTGFLRSLQAIIVGIAISAAAIYGLGLSMSGWWTLGAIGLFSLGEMTASPTKLRYVSGIAPPGKQGQYLGYANFTTGIGWSVGSIVAGSLYQEGGDKIVLARRYLVEELGMASEAVAEIRRGEVLETLQTKLGIDAFELRSLLWEAYEPYSMWLVFTAIGVASMLAIVVYDWVLRRADARPDHSFNRHGNRWVLAALFPIVALFIAATVAEFSLGLLLNTIFFGLMLVVALLSGPHKSNGRVSTP